MPSFFFLQLFVAPFYLLDEMLLNSRFIEQTQIDL